MIDYKIYFYKNQEVIIKTEGNNYKGYISDLKGDYIFVILYALFKEDDMLKFDSGNEINFTDRTNINIDNIISEIHKTDDNILIYEDIKDAYVAKIKIDEIIKGNDNIVLKINVLNEPAKREGREFLRVNAFLQFSYDKISLQEFIELKEEYISKSSFTTSVYGIYKINMPHISSSMPIIDDTGAPINPRLEKLLIAINSKLDIILSLLNPEKSLLSNVEEQRVSISGSGIMFNYRVNEKNNGVLDSLKYGDYLKMTILFPTIPQFIIKLIAQVVRVEIDSNYSIACKFAAINEYDRDEIIKYTLERQRQQIKKG
ncbi:MAG: PilZ domain-containing protein [Deltaproteobacteria bacterium]|nr:PilZ domain-containing protein [Deltaproteobacteria bacterium]